uniref:SAM_3 domain-containing protein n=1 Tax=Macrostomum lignano TaxID=282301 RepID=A0A1I8F8C9_9PLAT
LDHTRPGSHPPAGRAVHAASSSANGAAPSPPLSGSTASPRSPQLEPTPPPPPPPPLPPPPPPQPLSQAEPSVTELTANCSPRQVADWLRRQRFNTLTGVFKNFSGYDLLRLSRNDLTEICGCSTQSTCPSSPTRNCSSRITSLFQADGDKISQVLVYGPTSIAVCITDEMVAQMESESKYTLHVQPDLADPGRFRVFMRERRHHCAKGGNSGCAGVFASLAGT